MGTGDKNTGTGTSTGTSLTYTRAVLADVVVEGATVARVPNHRVVATSRTEGEVRVRLIPSATRGVAGSTGGKPQG